MERLTKKRADNGRYYLSGLAEVSSIYHKGYGRIQEGNAVEKLGQYEDFEEIFRSKMTDAACEFLKDKEEFAKWLDRNKWTAIKCAEYAREEGQGKLLKLPCEIGQRVYEIYQFMGEGAWEIDVHTIRLEDLDKIGKTVFLTREEAEAALERMGEK